MNWSSCICTSVAGTFVLATMSFAGGSNCCVANGAPGCDNADCQTTVCNIDPFCCDVEWDGLCANLAADFCPEICAAGGDCPASDHDCFTAGGPGCTDVECCLLVCAADPFCCTTSWDVLCVNGAFALCGSTGEIVCPEGAAIEGEACGEDTNGGCNAPVVGNSTCCTAQALPGCDDVICEALVCGLDPFCCDTAWDGICAASALENCPDICSIGGTSFEPIACNSTVCGTSWADGGTRDTDWFEVVLTSTTEITFSGTGAFPIVIGIVDTGGIPDCGLATALNPFATAGPFAEASFTTCLNPGTYWFFVSVNGFEGFPCTGDNNDYVVTLTCGGECVAPACGDPNSGDCFVANGTPFCDDEECCLTVCAADPFCCDTAWDGLCATAAGNFCVDCGKIECPEGAVAEAELCGDDVNGGCNAPVIGDSNCCTANGGLGCDDAACSEAVCLADPFCCETAWDGICAAAALELCPGVCSIGGTSFEAITCGTTVCGTSWATGGTRDTDWYELVLEENTAVTFSGTAQFPLIIGVVDTGGIPDCGLAGALNPFATATPCQSASFTVCLPAGTHWLFVSVNGFEGFPCDSGSNDYVVTLECVAGCEAPACGDPNSGSCFVSNGTPFCDDEECCLLICSQDPFCCDVTWDGICATAATAQCGAEPIANDNCEDRLPITDGVTSFSTIGATTDGPALPAACDEGFGLAFVNDVWYNYDATCAGVVTASTCSSADFDTRLAVYTGDCGSLTLVACNDDGPGCAGFTSLMTWNAECGVTYKLRVGGFGGSGTGQLSISCDGESCKGDPCPWDLDGNGIVDGADLGALLNNWGNPGVGDFDGSGEVDGADLGALLNNWGDC